MKGKKNIYILIPAVCLIWGVIIYRIIDFSYIDETHFFKKTGISDFKIANNGSVFQPSFNYPDPFLKNLSPIPKGRNLLGEILEEDEKESTELPTQKIEVEYRGFITESKQRQRLALLVIDGEEVFLSADQSHNEVILKHIAADSILLNIGNQFLYIRKSQ